MAVYTDITDAELDAFLAGYDLGAPLAFLQRKEGGCFLQPHGGGAGGAAGSSASAAGAPLPRPDFHAQGCAVTHAAFNATGVG